MSSGAPVVATNIGGLPEVIEDGVSGFLHDPGDVSAMAASATRLLTDGELHRQAATAARQRAITHFGEDQVVPLYAAAYEEARRRVSVPSGR